MTHSSANGRLLKVGKPRPDFPLFPHANGRCTRKSKVSFVTSASGLTIPKGKLLSISDWIKKTIFLLAAHRRQIATSSPSAIGATVFSRRKSSNALLANWLSLASMPTSQYALRHTFATMAGECCDQVAVNCIMGHADDSMAANDHEGISDGRLQDASNTVRSWLFGSRKPR